MWSVVTESPRRRRARALLTSVIGAAVAGILSVKAGRAI
jgi:hypothetical protein